MTAAMTALTGAQIFDGTTRHVGHALLLDGARVAGLVPETDLPAGARVVALEGGLLCPGFVDLQVNGGGGVLFNDEQSVDALRVIAEAHAGLGATSILPTLITDVPERTIRAIEAVAAAVAERVPGIVGLHLEGPHLSRQRKGAHDPALIRPMDETDLAVLLDAAQVLPVLKVTVAPETVTPDQIRRLNAAGVLVSLGHSDADYETCAAAAAAGARCVTHLFNAMSQLGNREPGLVGAALGIGALSAGLIADGVHVHPQSVRAAMAAKRGPGQIFLVSDAMSVAGLDQSEFRLNGRRVLRRDGRLTLEDGTLAGADLDLLTAVGNLVRWGIVSEDVALSMATSVPATLHRGFGLIGRLAPDAPADILHLSDGAESLLTVWRKGDPTFRD
jgi:N-acetylglucosamine-6-phosphate deacetylase